MPVTGRRRFLQGSLALAGASLLTGCSRLPLTGPSMEKAVRRIGLLGLGSLSSYHSFEMQERLSELGWVEGQNVVTERRNIPGGGGQDRLDALAAELMKVPVSLIVAMGSGAALAAKRATTTIPIVMVGSADPVTLGLVTSLGRPGGNVTGLSSQAIQLSAKRVQIVYDVIPHLKRLAVAWSSDDLDSATQYRATEQAAQGLGISVYSLDLRLDAQSERRIREAVQAGANAAIMLDEAGTVGMVSDAVGAALRQKLPSMSGDRSFTTRMNSGLMAYGPNPKMQARRAAEYVDKILRGANPADLPVQQPNQFDFAVNLHTAQALGLTIPRSVLEQATEVN